MERSLLEFHFLSGRDWMTGRRPKQQSLEDTGQPAGEAWRAVVGDYSTKSLKYAQDRFPALSGLAKQMRQTRRGDRYVAGMWESTLLDDLCWLMTIRSDILAPQTPDEWIAPSFSWASVFGHVRSHRRWPQYRLVALVHEISCTPRGRNDTGRLAHASISLRGPAFPALFKVAPRWPDRHSSVHSEAHYVLDVNHALMVPRTGDKHTIRLDCGEADVGGGRLREGHSLLCLPLGVHPDRYDEWSFALVLARSERDPSAWERVGYGGFSPPTLEKILGSKVSEAPEMLVKIV